MLPGRQGVKSYTLLGKGTKEGSNFKTEDISSVHVGGFMWLLPPKEKEKPHVYNITEIEGWTSRKGEVAEWGRYVLRLQGKVKW